MYRYNEDTNKGQCIGDKIRKVLFNADLRIVYAEGERRLVEEDYQLFNKLGGKPNKKKAIKAKAERDCYTIYIENIQKIRGEILVSVDAVLSRYSPQYKRMWVMFFLEKAKIQDIADTVGYSYENVSKVIARFKRDLCEFYEGGQNNATI